MKRYRLNELPDTGSAHFLSSIIPGKYLCMGGIGFKKPNQRSHDTGCECKHCDGEGVHKHADDSEVFVLLQGKAVMEVDGEKHDMVTGDIIVCEPGEDHHLVADAEDPCINLWLHAGDHRHREQAE